MCGSRERRRDDLLRERKVDSARIGNGPNSGPNDLYLPAPSQLHLGQPLSSTIFHRPPASRLHTELNVPMRFPAGSRTGPDVIASVPESSTSTCSGSHENGACAPSKNGFQRSATCLAPRDTRPFEKNTVSSARNETNAAGSRSAIVFAKAISVRRTCSFNSALVSPHIRSSETRLDAWSSRNAV